MAVDISAASGTQNAELTENELRLAITLAGVRPCGQSPLADDRGGFMTPLEEPYDQGDVEQLFRKGLLAIAPKPELKPEWKRAITVLSDPVWDLSMILSHGADIHYDRYYARSALTAQSLVFFRPAHGVRPHHISFPYGPADLLRLLDEALVFAMPAFADDSGTEFSYKEYIVLLGCIDALRQVELESALRREDPVPAPLTLDRIREALRQGTSRSDRRWLVSIGNLVSPFELALTDDDWSKVLEGLVRRGYLDQAGNQAWTPGPRLSEMVEGLMVVPAFSAFELTFNKASDVFEINYFAALRGTSALWLFDFFELATPFPKVSVAAIAGEELAAMLDGLVDESRAKSDLALRTRAPLDRGAGEATRLPSPPTLRGLKVPSTVERAAAPEDEPATTSAPDGESAKAVPDLDLSDAETVRRSARQDTAMGEPPPVVPAPAEPALTEAPPASIEPGGPPEQPCPSCGLPVLVGKKFCRHCGKEMVPPAPALPLLDSATIPPKGFTPPVNHLAAGPAPAAGPSETPWTPSPSAPLAGDLAPVAPGPSSGAVVPPPPPASPGPSSGGLAPSPPADALSWLRGSASGSGSGELPPAPAASPWSPVANVPPAPAVVNCGVCAMPVPDSARFCGHCGANVAAQRERTCPACKGRLAPNARFCAFCGHSVT